MHTSHTETQMETAEQKQTHGSGRILKPGPYSIKASLGPSSLEDPPSLPPQQPALTSCGYPPSLPPPPSVSWSSVEQLPRSPASRSCHSAAPPCQPHSTILPPPPLISLSHHYECSASLTERYSKGRQA